MSVTKCVICILHLSVKGTTTTLVIFPWWDNCASLGRCDGFSNNCWLDTSRSIGEMEDLSLGIDSQWVVFMCFSYSFAYLYSGFWTFVAYWAVTLLTVAEVVVIVVNLSKKFQCVLDPTYWRLIWLPVPYWWTSFHTAVLITGWFLSFLAHSPNNLALVNPQ